MSERVRIIVVILFITSFIFLNKQVFKFNQDTVVVVSIILALVVYSVLVLYFNKKRKSK